MQAGSNEGTQYNYDSQKHEDDTSCKHKQTPERASEVGHENQEADHHKHVEIVHHIPMSQSTSSSTSHHPHAPRGIHWEVLRVIRFRKFITSGRIDGKIQWVTVSSSSYSLPMSYSFTWSRFSRICKMAVNPLILTYQSDCLRSIINIILIITFVQLIKINTTVQFDLGIGSIEIDNQLNRACLQQKLMLTATRQATPRSSFWKGDS